jgi:N-acetylneuraminic acid mutarotase
MSINKNCIVFCCFLLLLITSVLPSSANGVDYWTTKESMPSPSGEVSGHVTVLNGQIYAVASGVTLEVYNPTTDIWTIKTPMPKPLDQYFVAACLNKLYVIGQSNQDGVIYNLKETYDPVHDTWVTTSIDIPIDLNMQPVVVNSKIYVFGGISGSYFNGFTIEASNTVYDPKTNLWATLEPIPTGVAYSATAALDNKIYLFGGIYRSDSSQFSFIPYYTNLVQIYDIATNTWTRGENMSNPIAYSSACATTGREAPKQIYVIGGKLNQYGALTNSVQVYNPATNTWSNGTAMPTARYSTAVVNINDKLYAIGGRDGNIMFTANEEYTPANYDLIDTQSPIVSLSPTESAAPTPTVQTITVSPTSTPNGNLDKETNALWITMGTVAIAGIAALIVVWVKKKR